MVLKKVRATCKQHELIHHGNTIVAACSGGADSVVLTHVLHRLSEEYSLRVYVVSIDHGLRDASKQEVELVCSLARDLNLPFRGISLDLKNQCEKGSNASIQARAREKRYAALLEVAKEVGAQKIAVGHHRDDQVETVLSRFIGGSGLRGFRGIHPQRNDSVVRPLFDCTKREIIEYARKNKLQTVFDPSNRDTRFERVRLREKFLPLLMDENPRIFDRFVDLADEARELFDFIEIMIESLLQDRFPNGLTEQIPFQSLKSLHPFLQKLLLKKWLESRLGFSLSRAQTFEVFRLMRGRGEVLLPQNWMVTVHENNIILRKIY